MAETEAEQIEILKKWWQENGRSTVAGVAIALVGYFGWSGWQAHQQAQNEAAADLYQQMTTAGEQDKSQPVDAAKVAGIAEQLRSEYAGSVYATFAALHLAKEAVGKNDLAKAIEMLQWAQKQKPEKSLVPVVAIRLAQAQYAQGEYDAAVASLAPVHGLAAWHSAAAELKGDVALAQGQQAAAREAYRDALQALDESGSQDRRQNLEVKLADLAQEGDAPAASLVETGKDS
jgi:predicted negative regulator of RcsB-dependent stress response